MDNDVKKTKENEKRKGPRIPKERLDYVDLWKYFEKRGSEVKAYMFKVVTWILGFAAVLFGFVAKECFNLQGTGTLISHPPSLIFLSAVGIAIAYYADIVICDFGYHINRNFDRAHAAREGDRSIDDIWDAGQARDQKNTDLPKICKTLRNFSRGIFVVFVLLFIIGIIAMFPLP